MRCTTRRYVICFFKQSLKLVFLHDLQFIQDMYYRFTSYTLTYSKQCKNIAQKTQKIEQPATNYLISVSIKRSRSWMQSSDISDNNFLCWSREFGEWVVNSSGLTRRPWSCWQSWDASGSYVQVSAISCTNLQLLSLDNVGWGSTWGARKGCWSSWGILHLWLRSHARHLFIRSTSHGFESASYLISWFGSVITLNLAQNVLYSEKGVLPYTIW